MKKFLLAILFVCLLPSVVSVQKAYGEIFPFSTKSTGYTRINGDTYKYSLNGNSVSGNFDGSICGSTSNRIPRPVIVDTDWWTDVDDAMALRIMLWAEREGLVDLVGICIDAARSTSVKSLDTFLNYEGRPGICIGIDKQATDYNGTPVYHETILNRWPYCDYQGNDEAEDCVAFYRRALASVTTKVDIINLGYLNAISRLLDSEPDEYSSLTGKELISQKVNKLWQVGGNYPNGLENNFKRTARSRAAAFNILNNWPTQITFLGFEVSPESEPVLVGGTLKNTTGENDLLYECLVAHGNPDGRSAWDPMAMYLSVMNNYAISGYVTIKGTNTIDVSTGKNSFIQGSDNHEYVVKRYPDNWYQWQLNTILEKRAWGCRELGGQQLVKP